VPDPVEAIKVMRVLAEIGIRELAPETRWGISRRLVSDGIGETELLALWHYANRFSDRPERLLGHWINRPSRTRMKLREMMGHRTVFLDIQRRILSGELRVSKTKMADGKILSMVDHKRRNA